MNRRKKKKQFKKRYGFNLPRNFPIQTAKRIAENRGKILAAFERLKRAILDLWEGIKKPALELAEALKAAATAFILKPERKRRQYVALVDFQTKILLQQGSRKER